MNEIDKEAFKAEVKKRLESLGMTFDEAIYRDVSAFMERNGGLGSFSSLKALSNTLNTMEESLNVVLSKERDRAH